MRRHLDKLAQLAWWGSLVSCTTLDVDELAKQHTLTCAPSEEHDKGLCEITVPRASLLPEAVEFQGCPRVLVKR